jgi:hypothetical protein
MAKQPGKGPRGPREVVADAKDAAEGAGAPVVSAGDGPSGKSDAGRATWAGVQAILLRVEAEHGIFARVTVPFDAPKLYIRPSFGAAVEKGEKFTVLLCSGTTLVNPGL